MQRRGSPSPARRAAAGALQQLVRILPALGGRHRRRGRHRAQRYVQDRGRAPRRRGRDGVRRGLPPTDPPDRRGQPQGPQQHPRPGTGRRRIALGDRLPEAAATTRSTPTSARCSDFDAFVKRAQALGLEVALDLALQAAPDHPWVKKHPEWFTTRADGSIAYAENPPKKYQDIYPVNFDNDPDGIYAEVLRVVRHWMKHGVRIFRVDNPHTKPLPFWERLLAEVRESDPDVIFLAEAFTKPPMMQALAKVGFQQSYTYFTWRNTREEIESYLSEVAHETSHFMRPELLREHPGHPPRVPPARRPAGVPDPGSARRDRIAELGRVRRLRAVRADGGEARERGVPRLGEVPDPGPRLGGRRGRGALAGAVPHPPQRDPQGAPGAAAAARPDRAPQRRRERRGLQQERTGATW